MSASPSTVTTAASVLRGMKQSGDRDLSRFIGFCALDFDARTVPIALGPGENQTAPGGLTWRLSAVRVGPGRPLDTANSAGFRKTTRMHGVPASSVGPDLIGLTDIGALVQTQTKGETPVAEAGTERPRRRLFSHNGSRLIGRST